TVVYDVRALAFEHHEQIHAVRRHPGEDSSRAAAERLEARQQVEGEDGAGTRALEQRERVGAQSLMAAEGDQWIERRTERVEGQGGPGIGGRKLLIHEGTAERAELCTAERFGQLETGEP